MEPRSEYTHSPQTSRQGMTSALAAKYFPEEGTGKRPLSTTIYKKSMAEVFGLLKQLENFPQFFDSLHKVDSVEGSRAQWHFRDSRTSEAFSVPMSVEIDQDNHVLVWKAEDKAGFDYSVAIELAPASAQRGTVVRLMVAYDNLAGEIAGKFEKLFGKDAEMISRKNLHRLRAFCETGSVPTTEGQPSGRKEDLSETHH